ncbi:elongation factor 2 kinase [Trichoderma arundinaceum]|uniref:Elongation factor 2 kinase n=1 Tax=Trichoderma arundinaceum TaxID=490622 RepID=A0A395NG57_TRIAR|nr:elongation factor 2 kinase [Trichoderma arundinaceum]
MYEFRAEDVVDVSRAAGNIMPGGESALSILSSYIAAHTCNTPNNGSLHLCRLLPLAAPVVLSVTQRAKGEGFARCMSCVHGHHSDTPKEQSDSGRYNQSSEGSIDYDALKNPFAEGVFRWVAKGKYTSGPRQNQACAVKWFKSGAVFSKDYFTYDVLAVDKALEIVNRFNHLHIVNKTIKINVPAVGTFKGDDEWAGQKALFEPFIQNYQKFNSNSGWNDGSTS